MGKAWADGPLPLIPTPKFKHASKETPEPACYAFATEMALVHNFILRGINAMILQAPHVKNAQDVRDFILFCDALCVTIHEHHAVEETFAFPLIEAQTEIGIMDRNVVEHSEFHPGFHALGVYVRQVKNGVAAYDSAKLLQLVDSFAPKLCEHLASEVDMLCALDRFEVDWPLLHKSITDYAVTNLDQYREIPVFLCNMDLTFENNIHVATWPGIPWFILWMFRWRFVPKFKGAWRFGSCDLYGVPKELPFAPEKASN